MITDTGVMLYRWYQMGVTDFEDLKWLLSFYRQDREQYPLWFIGAELQSAKEYYSNR